MSDTIHFFVLSRKDVVQLGQDLLVRSLAVLISQKTPLMIKKFSYLTVLHHLSKKKLALWKHQTNEFTALAGRAKDFCNLLELGIY